MQKDITDDRTLNALVGEFRERLQHLERANHLRHGLAAMALAMQQELTRGDNRGQVAHAGDIEVIMRGVYSALAGDGSRNQHVIQKLSLGYCALMCKYYPGDGLEIIAAFQKFRNVLRAQ